MGEKSVAQILPRRTARLSTCRLAVLLAFLATAPAGAQEGFQVVIHEAKGGPWLRVDSEHFTFLSNAEKDVVLTVAHNLEEMRYVFSEAWTRTQLDAGVPTRIYVFGDEGSFQPFRLRGIEAAGYLVPHEHGYYAAVLSDGSQPAHYVYKEYIHQLLHDNYVGLPLWLRHGLADYYSTFEVEGDEARVGKIAEPYRQLLINFLGPAPPFPLEEVLTLEELPENPRMFFALSWAMTHYLMWRDPALREKLNRFVQELAREAPAPEALRTVFAFDYAALERDLKAYLHQTEFFYHRLAIDREAHPLRVTVMPEHEALYHLGDLKAHGLPSRGDEAEALFRKALALAPEHGPSWAGLGYVAELRGDDATALGHYEKAVALDGGNYLSQYLYGEGLLRSLGGRRPESEDETRRLALAVAALEKSVQLRPEMAQGWARLGFAFNLSPEASPRAVEVLERALAQMPARSDVAMNLLLAYARVDDREGADAMIRRMRLLGADEATLGRAREIRLQMDYRLASLLYRQGKLDDAVAVFTRIQAESQDPALQKAVAQAFTDIEPVVKFHRFTELYNEAARRLRTDETEGIEAVLDELDALAKPGLQREAVEILRRVLEQKRPPVG